MAEGEIDNLTMEQYLALTRGNQAPSVVKAEIGGNVNFEIKSQFMRELREDTFSKNKNDDAHEHVERVLDIFSLFNIPEVSHDAVMLCIFPITLTGAAKRRTTKQLEEIRNFKQEGDKTLYQAWEWYNDLLYKCPTHEINTIKSMTLVQALTAIQTMADHCQKWHDGSFNRNIESSSNSEGIDAIVNKLENLGRDMKKLKENIYAIQVGCQNCGGAHLDKHYPLKEEVKSIEEAKYGDLSLAQRKAVYADKKISLDNGRHEISISSNKCTQIIQTNDVSPKILPCQLPLKELNPRNFTLPCTIGSLNFYAMADLGVSVNVIPKSIFEHLKLAQLKKTDMLVEMADMLKKSPIRIVENVLFKIDKFLFTSDFVVMNMLNTRNETMILGRPFLATIHAEIDVFNKEISLGIGGELKFWLTCDPNIKECNGGHEVYEMNKEGDLKKWYCYYNDDRKRINEAGLSFPEFLLVKYEENQEKGLIWDERKVQGDNTYWWHDQKSKEEERRKLRINIEEIDGCLADGKRKRVKIQGYDP
ncbi:hypothetical protein Tco_0399955 [Tanacetum coccineum]